MSISDVAIPLVTTTIITAALFFSIAAVLMVCYNRGIVDGIAAKVPQVASIDYLDACAILALVMILKSTVAIGVNASKHKETDVAKSK